MLKRKTDVLVVGGGPVGLFTALQLAEKGVEVQVLEEQWRAASRSYALALHPASLSLLGELGIAEALVDRGNRVESVGFYEHENRWPGAAGGLSVGPHRTTFEGVDRLQRGPDGVGCR